MKVVKADTHGGVMVKDAQKIIKALESQWGVEGQVIAQFFSALSYLFMVELFVDVDCRIIDYSPPRSRKN